MPALHKDNPNNITSSSALFPRKNILHSAERIVFSKDNGNAPQLFAGMEGCVHLGAQPTCGAVHAPAVKEQHQPVREGESHLQRRQETAFRTVPSRAFEGKAMLAEHPGSSVTAGPRGSVTPVGNPTVLATTWGMSKCCCQVPKTGTVFANHRHAVQALHAMLLRGALTYPCHSQPAMSHRPACTARTPEMGVHGRQAPAAGCRLEPAAKLAVAACTWKPAALLCLPRASFALPCLGRLLQMHPQMPDVVRPDGNQPCPSISTAPNLQPLHPAVGLCVLGTGGRGYHSHPMSAPPAKNIPAGFPFNL